MSRAVLVTGATRGIGRATAQLLAESGFEVVGIGRREPAEAFPGHFIACDLLDRQQRARALAQIGDRHAIDVVINNVGTARVQDTGAVTHDALEEMWGLNVVASIDVAQAFLPRMKEQSWGRIINIASGAVLGKPGRVGYAATKAALIGFTRTMAIDLAPFGITANVIAPGQIETELFRSNNPADDFRTQKNLAGIPAQRLGDPREVAAAIRFFASDEASYVTGQTLYVCGGLTVGKSPI